MTLAPTMSGSPPPPLARLRSDLEVSLVRAPDGKFPAVVVADPLRNAYFHLAWPQSAIVLLWSGSASIEFLRSALASHFGLATTADEIASVGEFLQANQLSETDERGGWQRYAAQVAAKRNGWLTYLLHNYLFLRIPLLRPERLLQRLLPPLAFVYTRLFWAVLALCAAIGIALAQRQWSDVVDAGGEILRLEGLHVYAAALLALKAVHEFGHGLTTVRHSCRVPSMGIAVMLGAPVFYTDTTDSWRLSDKSARLAIVYAGVAAEMIVATLALWLWLFLPGGTARQICFALATTSIVLTLTINLNPFMRYDGYFALSDHLGVPNLQPRAFNLLVWRLRELLFGLSQPPPETLPDRLRRGLIVYAILTCLYRLVLFIGIAAIVYLMFGKAIGIPLAAIEIGVFIVMPIARETHAWWLLRGEIARKSRVLATLFVASMLAMLAFAPLIGTAEVPSVLSAAHEEGIFLPYPARLMAIDVSNGQHVAAGDVLFRADAKQLELQHEKALLELRVTETVADRLHVSEKERDGRLIVDSRLAKAKEKLDAVERLLAQLVVRAPFAGRIVDLDPEIASGVWLSSKRQLARLVSTQGSRATGLVADSDVTRLVVGARAVFVPDDPLEARRDMLLGAIAPASDGRLAEPMLAEGHGGSVPATDERGELRLRQGWMEVTVTAQDTPPLHAARGIVRIEATRISVAELAWRRIARVIVREQAF